MGLEKTHHQEMKLDEDMAQRSFISPRLATRKGQAFTTFITILGKHYVNLDKHIEDIGEWAREFFSLFPPKSYGETIGDTLEYCQQVSAVA